MITLPQVVLVAGHGRLLDPPSRASMWRVGFSSPPDYQDNQLFCGGRSVRIHANTVLIKPNILISVVLAVIF